MATTADVVVIGGGLAGIGVATALVEQYGKQVVVLDKCQPKLDGNDRFDPNMAASFKNAGMFDIGSSVPDIKEYLGKKTAELYENIGVNFREEGAFVMASNMFNALLTDVLLERVPKKEFSQEEPNVQLASNDVGVLKFPSGSQAEPEATMKLLIDKANSMSGLELLYGEEVTSTQYAGGAWTVQTSSSKTFTAPRLVVAAGPGSKSILKSLNLQLQVKDIYGVISQSQELTSPWLQGSILGAKSYIYWGCAQLLLGLCVGNTLEATSWFGESTNWTTHLYMNVHNNRIYLGGPRIVLPENYPPNAVEPATYTAQLQSTKEYADDLVKFPENVSFEVDQTWGGIMVFPEDKDYPLIGAIKGVYDNSLFISTGYASAGFREAYGAGHLCAELMEEGEKEVGKKLRSAGVKAWKIVLPTLGKRVKQI